MSSGILDLGNVVGPAGPGGIQGPPGNEGKQGLQGKAGPMMFPITVSAPDPIPGAIVGDFVMNTATVNIAIGNISSVAPGTLCKIIDMDPYTLETQGSLRGPSGPQGATGNTGPTGPQGPAGAAGPSSLGSLVVFSRGAAVENADIRLPSTPVGNVRIHSIVWNNTGTTKRYLRTPTAGTAYDVAMFIEHSLNDIAYTSFSLRVDVEPDTSLVVIASLSGSTRTCTGIFIYRRKS